MAGASSLFRPQMRADVPDHCERAISVALPSCQSARPGSIWHCMAITTRTFRWLGSIPGSASHPSDSHLVLIPTVISIEAESRSLRNPPCDKVGSTCGERSNEECLYRTSQRCSPGVASLDITEDE